MLEDADAVTLTRDAEKRIHSLLQAQGYDTESAGLRVSVERGGCAGLAYQFELAASPEPEDVVCEDGDVVVFVDGPSKQYLQGTEVTVEETAHGTGFCVENPNADQQCGCGLSFQ
ncbi:HesB/IscA family protein [Halomicrococcus sp. SG-WS-1]|uniref:HesB/IscA family protein n=1 Tax=Halomicrococcus sp. SG-WS-1 TaxID=3439057 RepID=UPI003F7984AF